MYCFSPLPQVPPCISVSLCRGWRWRWRWRWWRVEVVVVVVAVQVGNMNYLAGRRCSAWKTAVSMARMDEERQERDETDSSSQPSSIHPSTHPPLLHPIPSLPPSLSLSLSLSLSHTHSLTLPPRPPLKSLGFSFFLPERYKGIFATTFPG